FSLGEASRLEELFRECGFSQIETRTVKHTFVLPSFDEYYGPFERGGASTGQALAALPDEIRPALRDEVRPDFGDTSGQTEAGAESQMRGGRRWAATHPPGRTEERGESLGSIAGKCHASRRQLFANAAIAAFARCPR